MYLSITTLLVAVHFGGRSKNCSTNVGNVTAQKVLVLVDMVLK